MSCAKNGFLNGTRSSGPSVVLMPTPEEKKAFLESVVRSRGYAHRYHRLLAEHDLEVLKATHEAPTAFYARDRILTKGEKELLLVVIFTCARAAPYIIQAHIRKALAFGIKPRELLEALEMTLLDAGKVAFETGLMAWEAVVTQQEQEKQGQQQ
jgi:4-carboxymuconolactone decarboxylase